MVLKISLFLLILLLCKNRKRALEIRLQVYTGCASLLYHIQYGGRTVHILNALFFAHNDSMLFRFSCSSLTTVSLVIVFFPTMPYRCSLMVLGFLFGLSYCIGFPGGTVVKNPPAHAGGARDVGLIPGLGRSPGGGNGNPLSYSCLENFTESGAWRGIIHGVAKSQT